MQKRIWGCFVILCLLALFSSGCGYTKAKSEMSKATQMFSELKAAGGQQKVPYEYCSAEKHLEIANREFGRSDYGRAEKFAVRSQAASQTGLSKAK
jgi:hypothetical protein